MTDNNQAVGSNCRLPTEEIVKLIAAGMIAAFLYLLIVHPEGTWQIFSQLVLSNKLNQPEPSRFFIIIYLVLFFLARHYWISKPGLNHLEAELRGLQLRIYGNGVQQNSELVTQIEQEIERIRNDAVEHRVRQFIFGNTGKKISCWRRYHEIERLAVKLLTPEELRQRLLVVTEDLTIYDSGSAAMLRDNIRNTLSPPKPDMELVRQMINESGSQKMLNAENINLMWDKVLGSFEPKQADPQVMCCQLTEAMKHIDDDRDNIYQYLADWQNKASYLIGITVLIVLFIFSQEHSILFHFGMIGGLLSKLRGAINRNNISTDYGVSWATLFLTPLVGGITGWVSILLLNFVMSMDWLNLDDLLGMSWGDLDTSSSALALALVFGYSASLFEKVLDVAQGQMEKNAKTLKS